MRQTARIIANSAMLLRCGGMASFIVMPGFMPGIHVFAAPMRDVDGRDKPGHDASAPQNSSISALSCQRRSRRCEAIDNAKKITTPLTERRTSAANMRGMLRR